MKTSALVVGIAHYKSRHPKGLITFQREPGNIYDSNAIAAYNEHNEKIGHLSRPDAEKYAARLDGGVIQICAVFTDFSTYQSVYSKTPTHCYVVELDITEVEE